VLLAAHGRPDEDLAQELGRTVSAVHFMRYALHGLHRPGNQRTPLLAGPLREYLAAQRGQRQCPVCGAIF
jgi:hypothetical protein